MQIVLLTITIVLLAASQIVQKLAASQVNLDGSPGRTVVSMLTSVRFWIAAILLGTAMVTWLFTLTTAEVSKSYPILAMTFVLAAIASRMFLGETIGRYRWIGIALISAGAAAMMAAI